VDITPKTNIEGITRIKTFMQSGFDGFDTLEDAAAAIAAYTPERKRPVNPSGLRKVLRERHGRWYWHWDPQVISQDRTEVVPDRLIGLLDVALENVHVPTMLVRRCLERRGDAGQCRRLSGSHPPAPPVVDVAGAAHMIAGDRNDAFSDAVVAFLADRSAPRSGSRPEVGRGPHYYPGMPWVATIYMKHRAGTAVGARPSLSRRGRRHTGRRPVRDGYLMATGLTGEPSALVNGSGVASSRKV